MKLRAELDGETYLLELERNASGHEYRLVGAESQSGEASIVEVRPGVYSILLGHGSFTVYTSPKSGRLEVWSRGRRHLLTIADLRDRSTASKKVASAGSVEVRAQMPGKVIKILVNVGEAVEAGAGVIVVEAMKMQNEMKSPKTGVVASVRVREGATVASGEIMLVVE